MNEDADIDTYSAGMFRPASPPKIFATGMMACIPESSLEMSLLGQLDINEFPEISIPSVGRSRDDNRLFLAIVRRKLVRDESLSGRSALTGRERHR